MPNTSADLYVLRHLPINGDAPAFKYTKLIGTLDCADLPTAKFTPGIHLQVVGCTLCDREPKRDSAILDPFGDKAFAIEMKYGTAVPMRDCQGKHHRGRRNVPAAEFKDGDDLCIWCRLRATPPVALPVPNKTTSYMKAFRADGRRKVA